MALTQVTSGGIKDSEVKNADMADDSVGIAELSATGTAGNTTYLRGDNTWTVPPDTNTTYTHPNHSGEVTSVSDGATTITDDVVDEANLKISNAGTDGQYLQKQSGNTGGLTWATPSSGGGAVGTDYDDDVKVRFGTDKDLEIYHGSGHSRIVDVGTGILSLQGSGVDITNANASENMITCVVDGAVKLYYNGNEKLATTDTGILLTGNAKVGDSGKLIAGDGDDLQIYHDTADSRIDNNTGYLYIDSPNIAIRSDGGSEDAIQAIANGAVNLYYNGAKKFETNADGARVRNDAAATASFGIQAAASQAAELWLLSDAGDDYGDKVRFHQADGVLSIGQFLTAASTWETSIKATANGAVELYYDNSLKFKTNNAGAIYYGTLNTGDDGKATYGAGDDLQIFHDGSNSYIADEGTGNLLIRGDGLQLQRPNGNMYVKCIAGGAVELYHDAAVKLETGSDKVMFHGHCKVNADNVYDLGAGGARWKDLYLSGGLFVGGTGSANELSDYEEGTFDCKMITNSGTFPTQTTVGYYRKIGTSITVHGQIQFAATNGSGTGLCWIELPFNVTGARGGIALGIVSGFEWSSGHQLFLAAELNSQALYCLETEPNSAGHTHLSPASVKNAGSSLFSFSGSYICQ